MKPSGRQEVLKLKHAFETLLSRTGINDETKELTGPTQIHNLLEIVRKEQNIYNIVFNELIRQCTVECTERGELLANLRKKYAQLLDRVPRQVIRYAWIVIITIIIISIIIISIIIISVIIISVIISVIIISIIIIIAALWHGWVVYFPHCPFLGGGGDLTLSLPQLDMHVN